MAIRWDDYRKQRDTLSIQLFTTPGAKRTIAISPHIWWMDMMAVSLMNMGYNVLVMCRLYAPYVDNQMWEKFDEFWDNLVKALRENKAEMLIAGNASGLLVHPRTGELLHQAAGIPMVHYWWDELRHDPPQARKGMTPEQYLAFLKEERTLNVIWDLDVMEELATFQGITNTVHVPLATLPEFWPQGFVPVEKRPLMACFLGHCHFPTDWVDVDDDPIVTWAKGVVDRKLANLDRPMRDCILEMGSPPTGAADHASAGKDPWMDFRRPWEILNAVFMHRTRNQLVIAAANASHGKLALIGKGWDKLGLRANSEHAGENSGNVYAQSQASLNLFGGCVHGGMPLRPYDIGASGGVIVTHYQRALPGLFEIEKECLAFRNQEEMLATLDRIGSNPAAMNEVATAGRRRVLADHTWTHRMTAVVKAADERFGGPGHP